LAIKQPAHQIVIVGGGAGGLELATRLGNKLGKKSVRKSL
jgi:NADH dehydrogenase